ncbi:DnaJ domain-containing protein [Chelatococcus sp. SYSU_G07232]|uniref:DnaJ domain-containing protein n=1 Tax=Chelatococcus albus TaxID=3047466 RepID=A0ABT7ACY6_9HYPH|nr:DnaJ domain-containing protein [Chelatococcus sp. SYSU_G07232]MDJ1157219.1 DnaJ domain-containing protein [Chelatococcus sp. SYSU_G07232]
MITLLYGVLAVAILWWLSRVYAQADPKKLALALRKAGGIAGLALATFLLVRGRWDVALPVAGFGWWLLTGNGFGLPNFGGGARTRKARGAASRVRSATIEMELDHDSGTMRGRVIAGPHAGVALDDLGIETLATLYRDCARMDPDGARLLEAYLDRRFPRWREDADAYVHAGAGREAQSGAMSEKEAYEILGLSPGAGEDEIRRAHRALMKKLHPDQGGSTYLATRVNQAKETLLHRHR